MVGINPVTSYIFKIKNTYARLAQSVEHVAVNHGVVGSSPTASAK